MQILPCFLVSVAEATVLGVNTHSIAPIPGQFEMIKRAGFGLIRDDLSWALLEPKTKGVYDYSVTDPYMAAVALHGLKFMGIFGPSNPMYDNGTVARSDEGIAAYAAMVAAYARRYQEQAVAGEFLIELVNEPNGGGGYSNATLYAELVATTAVAVRAAMPSKDAAAAVQIVGPASENIDIAWLTVIFEAGVLQHLSQITVHPYRSDSPETALADFNVVRKLADEYSPVSPTNAAGSTMRRSSSSVPITINSGEWGYSSVPTGGTNIDVEMHGRIVPRQFLVTIAAGVGFSVYYDWRDGAPEIMGLVVQTPSPAGSTEPFTPKPAYNSTAVLASAIAGFDFVSRLDVFQNGLNADDDWLLLFKKNSSGGGSSSSSSSNNNGSSGSSGSHIDSKRRLEGGGPGGNATTLLVTWTSASFGHVARIPGIDNGCFAVYNYMGSAQPAICHDPRGLHVELTNAPQYLFR